MFEKITNAFRRGWNYLTGNSNPPTEKYERGDAPQNPMPYGFHREELGFRQFETCSIKNRPISSGELDRFMSVLEEARYNSTGDPKEDLRRVNRALAKIK